MGIALLVGPLIMVGLNPQWWHDTFERLYTYLVNSATRSDYIRIPTYYLGRKYDLEKAKQLMDQAGLSDGFETTVYPFPGMDKDATLAVTDGLSKIGIIAEVQFVDFGKYFQMNQERA